MGTLSAPVPTHTTPGTRVRVVVGVGDPVRARYPRVPLRLCVLVGTPVDRLREAGRGALLTVIGRQRHLIRPCTGRLSDELVRTAHGPLAVVPAAAGER